MTPTRARRSVTQGAMLAIWCLALAGAAWVLHALGRGDLAAPPAPTAWREWIEAVGPAAAIVACFRVIALAGTWYLIVVTVVGAAVRRAGTDTAVAMVDSVSPSAVRRVLSSACGLVASTAGLVVAVGPIAAGVEVASGASAAPRADGPTGGEPTRLDATADVGPPDGLRASQAVLTRLRSEPAFEGSGVATLSVLELSLAPLDSAEEPRPPSAATQGKTIAPDQWTVHPGDHFWTIAEETLRDTWETRPSADQIAAYWIEVIDANRGRLVAPGNPDLVLPGQVFVLPPVPERPAAAVDQTAGL